MVGLRFLVVPFLLLSQRSRSDMDSLQSPQTTINNHPLEIGRLEQLVARGKREGRDGRGKNMNDDLARACPETAHPLPVRVVLIARFGLDACRFTSAAAASALSDDN